MVDAFAEFVRYNPTRHTAGFLYLEYSELEAFRDYIVTDEDGRKILADLQCIICLRFKSRIVQHSGHTASVCEDCYNQTFTSLMPIRGMLNLLLKIRNDHWKNQWLSDPRGAYCTVLRAVLLTNVPLFQDEVENELMRENLVRASHANKSFSDFIRVLKPDVCEAEVDELRCVQLVCG
jgi:hypothetical protein